MADEKEMMQRLEAHRAAFSALALVMADITPGALDAIILAIHTFEEGMRQQNYEAAMIDELRQIRTRLTGMAQDVPADQFPSKLSPRADSDRE